jgi:TonB family protein
MSTVEMHQLEKAAMEDPFLADALEGYAYTQTPQADKEYLQTQLQSKLEKRKVIPIGALNRTQFLRIAALFILLAGCGWAVYQFGFNTPNKDIAIVKSPETVPSPIAADSNKNDGTLEQSTPKTEVDAPTKTIENVNKKTVTLTTQNRHTGKLNSATISQKEDQANDLTTIESNTITNEDRAATASVADVRQRNFQNGYADSLGYKTQTVTPGKENVIVMQRSKAAPMQEVIVGRSMKDSNYRKPHVTFEEAEPVDGTIYYDDYVAQNLQLPEEEMKKNSSGEVKLSFDVNEAGEAINITVEKSLCAECDKEAIRILKQGPKWVKKNKDKKRKLSIRF